MQGRRSFLWATALTLVLTSCALGTADARPKCGGKPAKFIGTRGDDVFRLHKRGRQTVVSRGGDDLIIAHGGSDRICAGKGDDVIVAGAQPDLVRAGRGEDTVYGGAGPDRVRGGPGADILFGDAGSDLLRGGRGPDRLFGGLVDDVLRGAAGDDLLVGGHGGDGLVGGSGRDWLRGGTNQDGYWGGAGVDTVSFATATPTNSPGGRSGVTVDLRRRLAVGEGRRERVRRVENVLGSPFDDKLTGNRRSNRLEGGFGNDVLRGRHGTDSSVGGAGSDHCSGFERPDPGCNDVDPRPSTAIVILDRRAQDRGLIVIPSAGDQSDQIRAEGGRNETVVTGARPLTAGPGCAGSGTSVRCPVDPGTLDYLALSGRGGDDELSVSGRIPREREIQLDGGAGDDRLTGTPGDDVILGGVNGEDRMVGGAGNDALISQAGRDVLLGGSGNDQLVTDDPCFGHVFNGGPGRSDIAGFARAKHARVRAKIGGKAVDLRQRHCHGTKVLANNEILEGTPNADVLIGDNGDNALILGAEGNDRLLGGGGDDHLEGEEGRDAYFGGRGRDLLSAKDRRRDLVLDCGPGSDYVKRDGFDPKPRRCGPPKAQRARKRKR